MIVQTILKENRYTELLSIAKSLTDTILDFKGICKKLLYIYKIMFRLNYSDKI